MAERCIKDIQMKILEIMNFIDRECRKNGIVYYIMGGTALGAVRHGGFIPWDDDLDIFMTPENYEKFKAVFNQTGNEQFVLQEWKIVDDYLEYAKVRMNGTTFIEENLKERKDLHHGIYVDIMILHKCPKNLIGQKIIYYLSKYVTLVALAQRNWKPKSATQKAVLQILKILPNQWLARQCYKTIYKYEQLEDEYEYSYFITKARFRQGIFNKEMFATPADIPFENTILMGPTNIIKYLELRYGDYMRLPSEVQRKADIHAMIYDTEVGFEFYYEHKVMD